MSNNDIGKKISKRRKELCLTMDQVGEAVGVGKSTVQRWESGQIQNMRRDKIKALADILQMAPQELIQDIPAKQKMPYIRVKTLKRSMAQSIVRATVNDPAVKREPFIRFIETTNRDPQFNDMMKLWEVSSPQTKDSVIGFMKVMNSKEKE